MIQKPMILMTASLVFAGSTSVLAADLTARFEASPFFEKFVDSESGVESYLLKNDLVDHNQQSMYFTAKSMTDDGRFLVIWSMPSEITAGKRPNCNDRKVQVFDLEKNTITPIEQDKVHAEIPYLDTKTGIFYWIDRFGLHQRDLYKDVAHDIKCTPIPEELRSTKVGGKCRRVATHLMPTGDRRKFFFDAAGEQLDFEGIFDVETGVFERWNEVAFDCNHGQSNTADDNLALAAWENASRLTFEEIRRFGMNTEDVKPYDSRKLITDRRRMSGITYPRVWLFRPGKKELIKPLLNNYATHENFTEDGRGVYFCSGDGVTLCDLESRRQELACPEHCSHAFLSADLKYVVGDNPVGGWYRGCNWEVRFFNRDTHRQVMIYSPRPKYMPRENQSKLHPDPHPQFVCNDQCVISTITIEPGRMGTLVTPVAPLIVRTTEKSTAPKIVSENLAWRTDMPIDRAYEITVPKTKCEGAYRVEAKIGGKGWKTLLMHPLYNPDDIEKITLRFWVPEGTEALKLLSGVEARFSPLDKAGEGNLFYGAVDPAGFDAWQVQGEKRLEKEGVYFGGKITREIDLPASARGKPYKLEWQAGVMNAEAQKITLRVLEGEKIGGEIRWKAAEATREEKLAPWQFRYFNKRGTFDENTEKVRVEFATTAANPENQSPSLAILLQQLNLRIADTLRN